jgi:hypothetical protein
VDTAPALEDVSMQAFVARVVAKAVKDVPLPEGGNHRVMAVEKSLADFCRHSHIRKLALFGSILRDDFRPESDVDILVEFEPGHVPLLTAAPYLNASCSP